MLVATKKYKLLDHDFSSKVVTGRLASSEFNNNFGDDSMLYDKVNFVTRS